jgi:hypothetical protein
MNYLKLLWQNYNNGSHESLYKIYTYYKNKNLKLAVNILKILTDKHHKYDLAYIEICKYYLKKQNFKKALEYSKMEFLYLQKKLGFMMYANAVKNSYPEYLDNVITYIPELVYKYKGDLYPLYQEELYLTASLTGKLIYVKNLVYYYYKNANYDKAINTILDYAQKYRTANILYLYKYLSKSFYKKQDYEKYILSLILAVNNGCGVSAYKLAKIYLEFDLNIAFSYLELSIKLGYCNAHFLASKYSSHDIKLLQLYPTNFKNLKRNKDTNDYFKYLVNYLLYTRDFINLRRVVNDYSKYYLGHKHNYTYLDEVLTCISKNLH